MQWVVADMAAAPTGRLKVSKLFKTPTSRLICFGSARGFTNAVDTGEELEINPQLYFNPQ